jgi:hypothetical protein
MSAHQHSSSDPHVTPAGSSDPSETQPTHPDNPGPPSAPGPEPTYQLPHDPRDDAVVYQSAEARRRVRGPRQSTLEAPAKALGQVKELL